MSIASALKAGVKTAGKVASTKPARIVGTSAAVGGGSYLALSGVGMGIEKVADSVGSAVNATGLGDIAPILVPDLNNTSDENDGTTKTEAKSNASTGIGTILLIGGALLVLFLLLYKFLPQAKKTLRKHR